jgi:hypothetical protein
MPQQGANPTVAMACHCYAGPCMCLLGLVRFTISRACRGQLLLLLLLHASWVELPMPSLGRSLHACLAQQGACIW